jgi:peptide subunit release factor 1 (eRF1)
MPPQLEQINAQLDGLAALEPTPFPIVSLYLNLQPDQHGRDRFDAFLRKELGERLRTYEANGPQRESLNEDCERIRAFVSDVDPSANGLALFASSGVHLFEALQLAAPISEHRLYVSDQPHLYPLARIYDAYPRYAVLHADTNLSRIFVIAANTIERRQQVVGTKTRRTKMGGWSQARYQRHIDNYRLHHIKEVVDTLASVVRSDDIRSIVIAGDNVAVPLVKDQLPKELAERIVDIVKVHEHAAEREVFEATIDAMREKDRMTDRERVDALIDAYRANGLAVVGVEETRLALERGQVDELVIAATPETIATRSAPAHEGRLEPTPNERVADELVARARRTSAHVRVIEDASLVAAIRGVGAHLRFKL